MENVTKAELRQQYRRERRALSIEEQRENSLALRDRFFNLALPHYDRIGAYIASDGEIDPRPIIETCWAAGKHCYFPCSSVEDSTLIFKLLTPEADPVQGALGMLEPHIDAPIIAVEKLDLLLIPLVAFNDNCYRLGRGAGFYDKLLAKEINAIKIGLAHDFQRVAFLPIEAWDQPMDKIITNKKEY